MQRQLIRAVLVRSQFAVEGLKAKKVAIIDDRTAYGQGLADEFRKFLKDKVDIKSKSNPKILDYKIENEILYYEFSKKSLSQTEPFRIVVGAVELVAGFE